jgi:dihydropteroate synthase
MGILNATPDSFSDGGLLHDAAARDARIRTLFAEGVDVLDVGGESTRPGHAPVGADEELRRVLPVIAAIRALDGDVPISIDTGKAAVAAGALAAGASFVNDVHGLADARLADVVRDAGCGYVAMRSAPLVGDAVASCRERLDALCDRAVRLGIPSDCIIVDPGLGFGDPPASDVAANLALVDGIAAYARGRPVLIGASRKRFVGAMTGDRDPAGPRRIAGSVDVAVRAARAGAAVLRVHDVGATVAGLAVAGVTVGA